MTMEEQSTSITKENPQSKTQNSQTTKQMTTTEEQYIVKRTLKYTTPYLKTINFDKISNNYYGTNNPDWKNALYEHKYFGLDVEHRDSNHVRL